ncbi:MAG: hypothetical protein ACI82F_001720 [Planctomycetota bacterium]|jgi:hypothetical protein
MFLGKEFGPPCVSTVLEHREFEGNPAPEPLSGGSCPKGPLPSALSHAPPRVAQNSPQFTPTR